MRRVWYLIALVALASAALVAQENWGTLSPLRNAQFVYVTSYDGPQFSSAPFPADRQAITAVQDALQKQHYIVVYQPQQADMIVVVESRPSEDILAVYDPQSWRNGMYLWRATEKGGFSSPQFPLIRQFQAALAKATGKTEA